MTSISEPSILTLLCITGLAFIRRRRQKHFKFRSKPAVPFAPRAFLLLQGLLHRFPDPLPL
ncbi:MAG TPA: hypothetical protein DDW68_01440 [Verrucomicrobiales bacterium]|nr:hypothetical protein [Verrucomicrobiales bacterium]